MYGFEFVSVCVNVDTGKGKCGCAAKLDVRTELGSHNSSKTVKT